MNEIQFENPPPRGKHARIAEALRAKPREWAIVSRHSTASAASASAQQVRSGYLIPYRPPGSFEAQSRTVDGEYRVYARYVGAKKKAG